MMKPLVVGAAAHERATDRFKATYRAIPTGVPIRLANRNLGFETNSVSLHQVLAVKVEGWRDAAFPLRPTW